LRVLSIWIVIYPNMNQGQHLEVEEKKTCTQLKMGRQVAVVHWGNAPSGATTRTAASMSGHALLSDIMDKIQEKEMCDRRAKTRHAHA
jgi:hypothetical protein